MRGGVRKAGRVVLPSFLVKVWDQDMLGDDLCGFGFTDDRGQIDLAFNRQDFSTLPMHLNFEGLPELFLEISELDTIEGTFRPVKPFKLPKAQEREVTFDVDLAS